MTIESKIDALTAAVLQLADAGLRLTAAITAQQGTQTHVASVPSQTPSAGLLPQAPAPVVTAQVIPQVQQAAPQMPNLPTFAAPVVSAAPQVQQTAAVPFSDSKGLLDYVMTTYKALGPEKGARIQGVLAALGYQNVNDVKSEHYAHFFAQVEALKTAP